VTDQALDPPPARSPAGSTPEQPLAGAPAAGARERGAGTVPGGERRTAAPGGPNPFVGRERELGELRAEIERPGLGVAGGREAERGRVLLVVGRPGIGRTAVAVELARQVKDAYPDGRLFARLTTDGGEPVPAEQTARTLLRALRADVPRTDPVAALREATEGRRLLLVLDDVRSADGLAGLLPRSPGSLVVATSDGPLSGVPDVRPCTLGGLDTPAAVLLLSQALGDIRLTNDPRGAETLVQEAGGHPTALRLIAAWLAAQPRMSLSEAAARLRAIPAHVPVPVVPPPAAAGAAEEAPAPAAGPPAVPSRVAAFAAPATPPELVRAFRLVHGTLPSTPARILRLLVLAPAGWVDAQVASALAGCSVAAARATLDDFVAGGLLHGGPDGRRPYRVPGCLEPLLRALAGTTDRPEDLRLARARMLERTVRLVHTCLAALTGETPDDGPPGTLRFGSPAEAADWLRTRLPALLAAARAAVADGELDTLARRLVAALVRTLVAVPGAGAMAAERYELHSLVLDVAERRGLHREKAAALINLADLDAEAGRADGALAKYRRALDAARAGDDTEAEGRILEALGGTYLDRQDLPRACDWFGRALALRQGRGELVHQARLHGRIGSVLTYLGRYGPALREWRSAAAIHRRLDDLPSQARALTETARVQEYAGHPEDALRTCRDALYWARQAGERRLEAAVLLRLADTLDRLGDSSGAGLQRAAAQRLFGPGELPAF
jgi:tetratricopeptide (TPR) repeat protein